LDISEHFVNFAKPLPFCAILLNDLSVPFSHAKFYDPIYLAENRLVQGYNHLAVVYQEKIFLFSKLETLQQFLTYPLIYSKMKLPYKINQSYLSSFENNNPLQNISNNLLNTNNKKSLLMTPSQVKSKLVASISQIMGNICNKKQKFPFLSSRESALKLLALELAIQNPHIDPTFRDLLINQKEEFSKASQLLRKLKSLYKTKETWSQLDFEEFIRKVKELSSYQKNTVIYKRRDFFNQFFLKNVST
jgi:adenylate/nucleoside-diphosphate kinase